MSRVVRFGASGLGFGDASGLRVPQTGLVLEVCTVGCLKASKP